MRAALIDAQQIVSDLDKPPTRDIDRDAYAHARTLSARMRVGSPDMGEQTFGAWLTETMRDCGYERPADLAKATGVNQSLIGRWMRDESLPGMANIARIAPALDMTVEAVAARAGHLSSGGTQPASSPAGSAPHPLARDLARLLPADPADSPLPEDERRLLEELISRVMDPYRRHLRRRRAG